MLSASSALASLRRQQQLAAAVIAVCGAAVVISRVAGAPFWLQTAIAAIGVFAAVAALGLSIAYARVESRHEWSTLLARPILRVSDALTPTSIYALGVDTEAPDAVAIFKGSPTHSPYVERDLDSEIQAALSRALESRGPRLVVVSGGSKSGKSRTILEALRAQLGHAWLVVPKDPESLAELAERGVPPTIAGCCVIWLDDIEPWTRSHARGLSPATLEQLAAWPGSVIVVATAGGKGVELAGQAATQFYEVTAEVLARGENLFLGTELTAGEQHRLALFVGVQAAQDIGQQGLGEYMIAAPRLLARLEAERTSRSGPAVVWAAVDFQRTGLLRPASREQLESVVRHYVTGSPADSADVDDGLRWALSPLYARTALLRQTEHGYAVHDWVVAHAFETKRPIHPKVWDHIVDVAAETAEEQFRVAIVSRLLGSPDRAERAARRAEQSGHTDGALLIGMLLEEKGRPVEAEGAYRRAERLGSGGAAVNLGVMALRRGDLDAAQAEFRRAEQLHEARGSSNLGAVLVRRGDLDGAERAFRRAMDAGDNGGASNLGGLLSERGAHREAEDVLRHGDNGGGASAAYNLGVLLQEQARLSEAEAAYRRAAARGSVKAASNLGCLLKQRGALTEAEAAYRRAASAGHARAWLNLGVLLEDKGDVEGAADAYRRAHDGGDVVGAYNLGVLCEQRGDLTGAKAAYRLAEQNRPAQAFAPGVPLPLSQDISERGPLVERACLAATAFDLAFLAEESGDLIEAGTALRRAAMLGHSLATAQLQAHHSSDPDDDKCIPPPSSTYARDLELHLAGGTYRRADARGSALGALRFGTWLHARGDAGEAEAAYGRAEQRGYKRAAFGLGLIHSELGNADAAGAAFARAGEPGDSAVFLGALRELLGDANGAETTYRHAADRGDGASAYRLGQLLERRGDVQAAAIAFGRADEAGDARAAFRVGCLLHQRGELVDAEAAYRRADARGSAAGASNLGVLLHARGDLHGAAAAWQRSEVRGEPAGAANLGVALQALGDIEGAEAAWRRASDRGDGSGTYNLAVLLHLRGDLEEARAAYRIAAGSVDEEAASRARAALERFPEPPNGS